MLNFLTKTTNKLTQLLFSSKLLSSINFLERIFNKLPHLPKKLIAFFVWLAPWLAVIGATLAIVTGVIMSLLSLLSLVTLNLSIIFTTIVNTLIMLLTAWIMIKAFKPLRKKLDEGWIYLFWSTVLSIITELPKLITGDRNAVIFSLTTFLSFYLLFNMKNWYSDNTLPAQDKHINDNLNTSTSGVNNTGAISNINQNNTTRSDWVNR